LIPADQENCRQGDISDLSRRSLSTAMMVGDHVSIVSLAGGVSVMKKRQLKKSGPAGR